MTDTIKTLVFPDENHAILHYQSEPEITFGERVKAEDRETAQKFEQERDESEGFSKYSEGKELILREPQSKDDKENWYLKRSNLTITDVLASKKASVTNALKIIREKLNAQTAAVFLINKNGLLSRFSLVGYSFKGQEIDASWYNKESYEISVKSFVGSAAVSQEGAIYGSVRYTKDLGNEIEVDTEGKKYYTEVCGPLKSAIVVPLHGRRRIYGVLRVINKVEAEKKTLDENAIFSRNEDVAGLTLLADSVAKILSDFVWSSQAKILEYLQNALSKPPVAIEDYYQETVDLLVENPETRFKAAILRILDPSTQRLRVVSTSLSDDLVGQRKNSSVGISEGLAVAGWVAKNKQRLILPQLRCGAELVRHGEKVWTNREWIIANNLQSFGCFPLLIEDNALGTISFYTRCKHNFDADVNEFTFLKSVTDLIAAFTLFRVIRSSQPSALSNLFNETSSKLEGLTTDDNSTSAIHNQDLVEKVKSLLRDARYDFRTANGIAKELRVDKKIITQILEEYTFSRKSLLKSRMGESLYTDRRKRMSVREFLAMSQRVLGAPFHSTHTVKNGNKE